MSNETRLLDNIAAIRQRVESAARRSGRSTDAVRLVAVTKFIPVGVVEKLVAEGCKTLGESRPQELWSKAAALKALPIEWHFIGHLQRNKVPRTVPLVTLVHSGDSLRLLTSLNDAALALGRRLPVLIEINISQDVSKHGFKPDEIESHLPAIAELDYLEIRGLMGMASLEGDLSQARREFAQLRELRDRLRSVAPPTISLEELSMGMSGDFEAAIEEGATIVRIGSALFEGVVEERR